MLSRTAFVAPPVPAPESLVSEILKSCYLTQSTALLTNLENPGMGIAMRHLLYHACQERVLPCKSKTLFVEVVKHVVWEHMLQDSRLASNGSRNVLADGCKELDIDMF